MIGMSAELIAPAATSWNIRSGNRKAAKNVSSSPAAPKMVPIATSRTQPSTRDARKAIVTIRPARASAWERVTALRSHYRIQVYRQADDGLEPWLNLSHAATIVGVSARTLRLAAERGEIDAIHPLDDGPWLFSRANLDSPAARAITIRARGNPKHPAIPDPAQTNLFPSTA